MKMLSISFFVLAAFVCQAQNTTEFHVSSKHLSIIPNIDTLVGGRNYKFTVGGVSAMDSVKILFVSKKRTVTGMAFAMNTMYLPNTTKDTVVIYARRADGHNEVLKKVFTVIGADVFAFVEQLPMFPGGDPGLIKFLKDSIRYPKLERDSDIEGRVITRFVVNEDGSVSDAVIVRGSSPGFDAEALRVISKLGRFTPGMQQGKPVKVFYNLPIVFKLK